MLVAVVVLAGLNLVASVAGTTLLVLAYKKVAKIFG